MLTQLAGVVVMKTHWVLGNPPNCAATGRIPETQPQGTPDAASIAPDGLITIVVSKDKVGNINTGDLMGDFSVRTYNTAPEDQNVRSTNTIDTTGNATANDFTANAAAYAVVGPPPLPDLVVSQLTASNNQARQGDKITFTATVKNQGQAPAGASATEFKLDGNTVLGTPATGTIAVGASRQVSVQWQTTARTPKGNHTIRASADRNTEVAESNEGNNTKDGTIFLQGNKTR